MSNHQFEKRITEIKLINGDGEELGIREVDGDESSIVLSINKEEFWFEKENALDVISSIDSISSN